MADNRMLDVWVVETNTAYRAVPFETVANWLQQGRLLAEDRVRPAGSADWFAIDAVKPLKPYLPQPDTQHVEDQAEALEPIEPEFTWQRAAGEEEDDDPDMIPLIDITLVLLIFFMMTAAISTGMFAPITTPEANNLFMTIDKGTYWVAIDRDDKGKERYALGRDDKKLTEDGPDMSQVTKMLLKELESIKGTVKLNIRADEKLTIEIIKSATVELTHVQSQINDARVKAKVEKLNLSISGEVRAPSK